MEDLLTDEIERLGKCTARTANVSVSVVCCG